MRSFFFGIETGRRALDAHRRALEVTAHNIANASTPGYSRQRVEYVPTSPYTMPGMNQPMGALQLGTGVRIDEITRMRDHFLDLQVRQESSKLGMWEKNRDLLHQVEVIFNEPSEAGIRSVMEHFFASMHDLGNHPESLAVRATVIERGQVLADTLSHTWTQLVDFQASLDKDIEAKVDLVNTLAREIASLNAMITSVSGSNQKANDLMDQRDKLLDRLSSLAEVNIVRGDHDAVSVFLAGGSLVSGNVHAALETRIEGSLKIYWSGTDVAFSPSKGEIGALFLMRDTVIQRFKGDLDVLATALRDQVNSIHREGTGLDGSTGLNFFEEGVGAAGMSISAAILSDPAKIAASSSGEVGDGSNALRLARVGQEPVLEGSSIEDFYRSVVAHLGIRTQEAARMATNTGLLVEHLEGRRQSVQGVSLDEEVAALIRYQHAYSAAARLVTAVDEMLDTVVNRLGLVGR